MAHTNLTGVTCATSESAGMEIGSRLVRLGGEVGRCGWQGGGGGEELCYQGDKRDHCRFVRSGCQADVKSREQRQMFGLENRNLCDGGMGAFANSRAGMLLIAGRFLAQ